MLVFAYIYLNRCGKQEVLTSAEKKYPWASPKMKFAASCFVFNTRFGFFGFKTSVSDGATPALYNLNKVICKFYAIYDLPPVLKYK